MLSSGGGGGRGIALIIVWECFIRNKPTFFQMTVIPSFHVTAVPYPHRHLVMSVLLFDILPDTCIMVLQRNRNCVHTYMHVCTYVKRFIIGID